MLVPGTAAPLEAEPNQIETVSARTQRTLSDGNVPLQVAEVEATEKTQTSRKVQCRLVLDRSLLRLLEAREDLYRLASAIPRVRPEDFGC